MADSESAIRVTRHRDGRLTKKLTDFIPDERLAELVYQLYAYVLWNVALGWGGKLCGEWGEAEPVNKRATVLGIVEEGPRTA